MQVRSYRFYHGKANRTVFIQAFNLLQLLITFAESVHPLNLSWTVTVRHIRANAYPDDSPMQRLNNYEVA